MNKINLTNEEKFKLAVQLASIEYKIKTEKNSDKKISSDAQIVINCYHSINIALETLQN